MIKKLNNIEIITINGGKCATSNDPIVQAGMDIGCSIGRAIGNTIRQVKSIFDIF